MQIRAEETNRLQWADYLVIGIMLAISASIGIYYRFTGGKQRTTEEFFSADRSMKVGPLAMALMVSFMSAVTLLGSSAEVYLYGAQFFALYLGYALAHPFIIYLYLPVFFKLQTASAFQYLEMRFGVVARLVASIAMCLQLLLYSGVVLYAPALALESTTGLSRNASVLLIGLICMFYSTLGGMKAVLITDVFQGVLMFVSLFLVIGFAVYNVDGGIAEVFRIAADGGRLQFDNFSIDPTVRNTWWSLLSAGTFTIVSLFGVNQVQVQRLLTVKDLGKAQAALWWNLPLLTLLGIAIALSGICLYAVYHDCDPKSAGSISNSDMIMPYFVMKMMGHIPGLAGLFIAGIFSAGLSTVSAILNSLAVMALEDYIKPAYAYRGSVFPEKCGTLVGKILGVMVGIACIGVAYLAQNLGSLIEAVLSIVGAIGGPMLGIFTLGMFTQSATEKGAVTGMTTSLAILLWAAFGQPRPSSPTLSLSTDGCNSTIVSTVRNVSEVLRTQSTSDSSFFYLYRISNLWYCPMGLVMTIVVGLLVSILFRWLLKEPTVQLNPDLLTPLLAAALMRQREQLDIKKIPAD